MCPSILTTMSAAATGTTTTTTTSPPAAHNKFKVMMLGDAGVGKTSIARRFVDDHFLNNYIHTIGIDFLEKAVSCDGQAVRLQIWDTAGQDRFRTIIRPYYRGASGIVLAFDVTDEKTFEDVGQWLGCISENTRACQIIQKVLVANKVDLPRNVWQVSREEAVALADKHGMAFFEVSAKEGTGVTEAFLELARLILKAQQSGGDPNCSKDTIRLDAIPVNDRSRRKGLRCCGGGQ